MQQSLYDQIVAQKGGEGSETAAAFLSNFMPPMPQSGDQRRHYFKLVFADEVRHRTTSMSAMGIPMASSRIEAYRSGQLIDSADPAHGDEKLIVWHGLHGPVPILIHIRPCGSGKATPAARREAPC